MSEQAYDAGLDVVEKCKNNAFIGFVSPHEQEKLQAAEQAAESGDAPGTAGTAGTGDHNGHAAPAQPHGAMADTFRQYPDNPEDYRR